MTRGRTIEIAAVGGILVVVAIGAVWLIGQAIPLGWDESVYAAKSRSLLTDIAVNDVGDLSRAGAAGRRVARWGIRLYRRERSRPWRVVLNLGALAMAWAFARVLWGPLAAIVALLTIVGSPVVIAEIALFRTDSAVHRPAPGPDAARLVRVRAPARAEPPSDRRGPAGGIGVLRPIRLHPAD